MFDQRDVDYVIDAHTNHAKEPRNVVRKWDSKTPYHIHPIWCATTILTETQLSEEDRVTGAMALLYHDVLEDTTAELPEWLSRGIRNFIGFMTFADSTEEMELVWTMEPYVRLLKLYDKVSNLLDGAWMSTGQRAVYENYTAHLCLDAVENFGPLNITRMAKVFVSEEVWIGATNAQWRRTEAMKKKEQLRPRHGSEKERHYPDRRPYDTEDSG
ncbi:MAG TPA: hypothetical protein VJJ22_03215 [Candidatus Paceibacterota bacterium]